MEIYCLNDETGWLRDQLDQWNNQFVWMAYWYEEESYEGHGEAIALGKDGFLYSADLGHNSCCGAFDDDFGKLCSVEDFFKDQDVVLGYVSIAELDAKVAQLLAVDAV